MVLLGPAWAPVKGNPRMPVSSDASLATWARARLPPGFLMVGLVLTVCPPLARTPPPRAAPQRAALSECL